MKRQHPTDPNLFWCSKHKEYHARDDFSPRKNRPFGISYACKKWQAANKKRKYHEDPRKELAIAKRYREKNKLVMLGRTKEWRNENKEYCRQYNVEYRKENKDKRDELTAKWRKDNQSHVLEYSKQYFLGHKDHYRELNQAVNAALPDRIVRSNLERFMGKGNVTPEMIEMARQRIIMKRTLKQLKEWRKEHESDRDVISGE